MPHRFLFVVLLAAVVVAPAGTEPQSPQLLVPGVTFAKQVALTPQGPVVVDVITAPRPTGLYAVAPALAHGTVSGGTEPVPSLEQEADAGASVGIEGDSFSASGYPAGIFLANGVLLHGALATRSSIGFDANGTLHVKRVSFVGTWKGAGQRRPLAGVNQIPHSGQVVLFTSAWGSTTPSVPGASEVVLEPFSTPVTNTDLQGTVTGQGTGGGGTPIPADGAVLMSLGSTGGLPSLQDDAPANSNVTVRLILPADWAGVTNAVGGGPMLVNNGKPVFHTGETFDAGALAQRDARGAVGQLADGRILFVTVDGGQPGYSVGMSIFDLARTMASLGARTAAAVDSGASVTAAFDGQVLNRPRTRAGSPVKDALLLEYAGVYAPPASAPLLGKNNAAAGEQLGYVLARPSTVNAYVTSPSGAIQSLDSGQRQPGAYNFTWASFDAEGTWHWTVKATDDQNRPSVAEQSFQYDLTLSNLAAPKTAGAAKGLTVRFQLSRAATAGLQIETPAGTVVRTLPPQELGAGAGSLHWDGMLADGRTPAYPGSYVARVTAVSEVGSMDLTAAFTLRS